ncbi:MAG: gmk [Chlamydiales bacterium]|jgi:guanylate kinase|nr:gmk [Chlamydiales bacterium]
MQQNLLFSYTKKGLLFILSAPAGTGKTTLVQMLTREFSCVKANVSCTTRAPRPNEFDKRDYFFITKEVFEEKIKKNDFLEYAEVFGHYYGTCRETVWQQQEQGNHVFLVIDTQGAMQLKGKVDAVFVFIKPPSITELRRRLLDRQTETMEVLERRLSWAEKELEIATEYDYQIVNEDLQICYQVLRSVVIAESHRTRTLSTHLV